jgi:hypothetical protein
MLFKMWGFLRLAGPKGLCCILLAGARGGAVVEALRYKPEGRGIDSRWCHWIFSLT